MKRTRGLLVFVVGAWLIGCGDDTTGTGGEGEGGGPTTSTTTTGNGAGGSGPSVTYSGNINEITASGVVALGDAQLCSDSHPAVACATADAEGAYTWPGLPANAQVVLRASKADFLDSTTFLVTGEQDVEGFDGGMISRATLGLLYGIIQAEHDPTKASVALTIVTPELDDMGMPTGGTVGVSGATATLTSASDMGPVYSSDSGIPQVDATSTGESGAVLWANVDPGPVDVDVVAPDMTCTLGAYGWPSSDGIASGELSADSASFFQVVCQ